MKIKFKVSRHGSNLDDYRLSVVGNCKSLGSWSPHGSIPMQLEPGAADAFETTDPIPLGDGVYAIEYKYLLRNVNSNNFEWELHGNPNRTLDVKAFLESAGADAAGSVILVEDAAFDCKGEPKMQLLRLAEPEIPAIEDIKPVNVHFKLDGISSK